MKHETWSMKLETCENNAYRNYILLLTTGVFFVVFIFIFAISYVFAQEESNNLDITFPIPELGNCASEDECRDFCDISANERVCVAFARDHGLADEAQVERVERLHKETGPGGCASAQGCDSFCREPQNHNVCIDHAVENGYMTPGEGDRARERVGKTGPGGCSTRAECESFCRIPENQRACLEHAVSEGHISPEDAQRVLTDLRIPRGPRVPRGPSGPNPPAGGPEPDIDVAKVEQLLLTQNGPGGCDSFEACDVFCNTPANDEVCFDFAVEHDLIPQSQLQEFDRFRNIEGPGGCRGRECETYCEQPGRENECLEFAVSNGFMSQEEFQEIKKFLDASTNGGPGGCRGRECESYCQNPDHRTECISFAKENQLVPPEEIAAMERIDAKMRDSGGPGGCRSEEECKAYCQDPSRFDECAAFATDVGLMSQDDAKRMLQQFIQVEQFGPPAGGEGFGSPGNFGPDGFGPTGDFGGEFNIQFEEEFQKRIGDFDEFREFFETGQAPPGFNPEGFEGFDPRGGFPGEPPHGFDGGFSPPGTGFGGSSQGTDASPPVGGSNARITLEKNPRSGIFVFIISDPEGIRSFSFSNDSAGNFGGDVGCVKDHRGDTTYFSKASYPVNASVLDCQDNEVVIVIGRDSGSFDFRSRPDNFAQPEGFSPESFLPPDNIPFPDDIGGFLRGGFPIDEQNSGGFAPPEDFVPHDFDGLVAPLDATGDIQRQIEQQFIDQQFQQFIPDGFAPPEGFEQFIPPVDQFVPPGAHLTLGKFLANALSILLGK
jgi:hypothetical protein